MQDAGRIVSRALQGNSLSADTPTGSFPVARNDPAFHIGRNPNAIAARDIVLTLPSRPLLADSPSCVPMGMIGLALNGVTICNALDEAGRDAAGRRDLNDEYAFCSETACSKVVREELQMIRRMMVLAGMVLSGMAVLAANPPVTVTLKDGTGKVVGTAKISDGAGGKGVKIAMNVKGLTPGDHAVHIHTTAKCEGPAFTTAGGHFNPTTAHHGINNTMTPKPHAGDMPNFTVKPNGSAKVTVVDAAVTLGAGSNSVFTGGGTALMIHAKADDLMSDPAGNAGDRIACGPITK